MVRLKIIAFIFFFCGCNSLRSIEICRVSEDPQHMIADCAVKDKKYTKIYPEEMQGYACWDDVAMEKLGNALSECQVEGSLPPSSDTWDEMDVCHVPCGGETVGFWCTNPIDEEKIKEKLKWCRRQ